MNRLKITITSVATACALAGTGHATLILAGVELGTSSAAEELAAETFSAPYWDPDPDLELLFKDNDIDEGSSSGLTLDGGYVPGTSTSYTVSWDMLNGTQLYAIAVKDGSEGTNVYVVTDVPQLTSGGPELLVAPNGSSISHVSFYGIRGTGVPDGGTTVALLGAALLGLGSMRRIMGRKA